MKVLLLIISITQIVAMPWQGAHAHALQPGYLELQSLGGDNWRAFWRKPTVKNRPMAIDATLPENCDKKSAPKTVFDGTAWVAQWITSCPGGLAGGKISIPGLDRTQTDVLVRYELNDNQSNTQRLTPSQPSFVIPTNPSFIDVLGSYLVLGIEHILEGVDHLLFVLALFLLIPDRWKLLGAITAFTVAHSITLAAATLGVIALPGPPVEAIIALSIMFLASELIQRDGNGDRLSERYPWLVSFSFGLLHGFGFAGALQEIGLPQSDVPLALLAFNLGVEAGQILFICLIVCTGIILRRIIPKLIQSFTEPLRTGSIAVAYSIGGLSAFWFIERLSAF